MVAVAIMVSSVVIDHNSGIGTGSDSGSDNGSCNGSGSDSGCSSDTCSGRGSSSVVSAAEAAVLVIVIPSDLLQFAWIGTSCGNEGHNSKQQ